MAWREMSVADRGGSLFPYALRFQPIRARSIKGRLQEAYMTFSNRSIQSLVVHTLVVTVLTGSTPLNAAPPAVKKVVPAAAPAGARVVVAGSGLDAPDLAVSFA